MLLNFEIFKEILRSLQSRASIIQSLCLESSDKLPMLALAIKRTLSEVVQRVGKFDKVEILRLEIHPVGSGPEETYMGRIHMGGFSVLYTDLL